MTIEREGGTLPDPVVSMATTAPGLICLYFGNPEECQNCGGWTGAESGPFPGDSRYCSQSCFEDAAERATAAAARLRCCDDCGYDQGEHSPECGKVTR